jgi:LemA protein
LLLPAAGALLLLAVWAFSLYNRLVAYRNECRNALAQVDVQLKRRHDLLPKLQAAVQGAMAHEAGTLQAVTEARAKALAAPSLDARLNAEAGLGLALAGFLLRVEAYPELKAPGNALELQREVSNTEDRIAFSRTYYNDIVANYNTLIEGFPALLIAGPLGFRRQPWFNDRPGA